MRKLQLVSLAVIAVVCCTVISSCNRDKSLPLGNTQILLMQVDYTTNTLVSGKELNFSLTSETFTITKEYQSPGDFGYIKLFYSEIGEMIFHGDLIWMGCGTIHFPTEWKNAAEFGRVVTEDYWFPQNGFDIILNANDELGQILNEEIERAWGAIQNVRVVRDYLSANPYEKVKVYFYQPSVGDGDPADWKIIFIFRRINGSNPVVDCDFTFNTVTSNS